MADGKGYQAVLAKDDDRTTGMYVKIITERMGREKEGKPFKCIEKCTDRPMTD